MSSAHTVLCASADDGVIEAARAAFSDVVGYRLIECRREGEVAAHLDEIDVSLFVYDSELAQSHEPAVVKARVSHPHVGRVVVAPAGASERGAAIARTAAAYLFVTKPVIPEQITLMAKRALELNELSRRHRVLSRELKISMDDDIFARREEMSVKGGISRFEKLVYASPRMADLVAEAKLAASTDLPILIDGETGTGKELLAKAIHYNSPRMNQQIHVQNCGGIPDDALHSELFGHVKGAFPGAISDRLGLFRAADGGTVFLDEISDVSKSFQVSLLRFLQEGEVKPLGSDRVLRADVRIVAASNRALSEMVERGEFRRDLYYRLKGFHLTIPPLRVRREDIAALTDFFIEKYAGVVGRRVIGVTNDVLGKLEAYDYPGNVRELETEVRRMVAVADSGGYVADRHLSETLRNVRPPARDVGAELDVTGATLKEMVEELERKVVGRVLERTRWNQSRAAEELGLSRVGLANKIKRYGLQGAA